MDAGTLKDRPIVAVSGAARLGKVSEILFETDPLRVSAIKASGDEGEFIVPIDRVSRFGPDAVMVETAEVKELSRATSSTERTLAELTQLKVVDEDGRRLGSVRSVEFDPDSGKVEQILAGEGGMLGIGGIRATIRASGVRGVGTDLLTVASSEAHDEAERDEPERDEPERGEPAHDRTQGDRTEGERSEGVYVTRDAGPAEPRSAE